MYRQILLIVFLMLLNTSISQAQDPTLTKSLDMFLSQQIERHGLSGLSIVVVDHQEILYQQNFGDMDGQFLFPIASLSKAFTATAILQLVDMGQLDLDAPIKSYIPWFSIAEPNAAAQITTRHLLHHLSGLGDWGYPDAYLESAATLQDAIHDLRMAELVAPVGDAYHYFNPNYQILGLLVEELSEQQFDDYLTENIFIPLQMPNTHTVPPYEQIDLIQGHITVFGLPVAYTEPEYGEHSIASGGIVSTSEDMGHFLIMNLNHGQFRDRQIISSESLSRMHTPPDGIDSIYAMGWKHDVVNDVVVLEHGGDLITYHGQMFLLPEYDRGFAIFINQNGFLHNFTSYQDLNHGLVNLLAGKTTSQALSMRRLGLILSIAMLASIGMSAKTLISALLYRNAVHKGMSLTSVKQSVTRLMEDERGLISLQFPSDDIVMKAGW